jgi:hypothetical protein
LGDELFDLERDIAPGEPGGSPPGTLRLQFEDWLSKGHIWLAELEGRIVGSTAWYRPIWDAEHGYIPVMCISPLCRRIHERSRRRKLCTFPRFAFIFIFRSRSRSSLPTPYGVYHIQRAGFSRPFVKAVLPTPCCPLHLASTVSGERDSHEAFARQCFTSHYSPALIFTCHILLLTFPLLFTTKARHLYMYSIDPHSTVIDFICC